MKRRDFIALLGSAAAYPLAASAQQVPVIGSLSFGATGPSRPPAMMAALSENGFVEGRNFEFDFRWGPPEQMPALAAELVRRKVAVIFAGGPPAIRAAMQATTTIPIVFSLGEDPIKEGLVTNLSRPNGNVTGFANFGNQLVAKRVELLHQLTPKAMQLGFLANSTNPNIEPDTAEVRAATDALGLRLQVVTASNERELESAFESSVRQGIEALLVGIDPWFREQPGRIAALAARHRIPAGYERRDFAAAGGLMSYGTDLTEGQRQWGIYLARILKGAKPAELPVQQSTKFEFIINLKTAKALGIDVPTSLLLRADEVIE
jgi:putative tryptophan/tyrosine transport system substrate-binding protein